MRRYPGDEYVDVMGLDYYNDKPHKGDGFFHKLSSSLDIVYGIANEKNKIAALTEIGYRSLETPNGYFEGLAPMDNTIQDWFTQMLDAVTSTEGGRRISYMATWANFSDTQFWVPFVTEDFRHEMCDDFVKFVEDLTNWYIRRSRRRFWKSTNDGDKLNAYRTLRYVLVQLAKVAAPFTPFIAEEIYTNLKGAGDPESVHLCDFPTANDAARQPKLEQAMADVMTAVELGRRLRADNDLKVRQPLATLKLAGADIAGLESLITDELNVKAVEFITDETELCNISFKANFKTLGKKCGPKMKAVAAAIAQTTLPATEMREFK